MEKLDYRTNQLEGTLQRKIVAPHNLQKKHSR